VHVLRSIALLVVALLRILLYQWVVALVYLVRALCRVIRRWCARRRLSERERKTSNDPCVPIGPGRIKHPDPLIYSQDELMALGLAVTWDNPDIQLYDGGSPISSWDLKPATTYQVVARVWNKSTDAPVVALPVAFSVLSFGVGGHEDAVAVGVVPHLGVKGGPDNPAYCTVAWTTPPMPGHYCLQVRLMPADDANRGNNHGAENTLVGIAHSPAELTFHLRNDSEDSHTYRFETDTYTIPEVPECSDERPRPPRPAAVPDGPLTVPTGRIEVPPQHDRAAYPIPDGWTIDFTPAAPRLAPAESVTVTVRATPPAGFTGRQPFNVNVFHDRGLAGGVTLYVDSA
jgi:hypothetical protein